MNLIVLLGAAVGSEEFCQQLFADPERAAALLNLTLTQADVIHLQKAFTEEKREKLCGLLAEIRESICPNKVCPFKVVIPGRHPKPAKEAA